MATKTIKGAGVGKGGKVKPVPAPKKKAEVNKKETQQPVELTEKEEHFCVEYAASDNQVKSFRHVWPNYSYSSANVEARRLLQKPSIKSRIMELQIARRERFTPTADRVLSELMKLAFYDPRDFFDEDGRLKPLSELDPDHASVIGGIETFHKVTGDEKDGLCITTKIKLPDKNAALEKLGKHLKLFTDKTEITGADGTPLDLTVNFIKPDRD